MERPALTRPGHGHGAPPGPGVAGAFVLAAVLGLVHLAAFADRYLVALLAPALKADLRLDDFEIGLLQGTAFVAPYVVGTLIAGPLAERGRRIALVAASILAWSAATLAFALADGYGALLAARLGLGIGQAALSPAALSLIVAAMPRDKVGRGVAVYTAGSTLGRSAALLGGGAVLAWASASVSPPFGLDAPWRAVALAALLPNALLLAAVLALREPPLAAPHARPARARPLWLARAWPRYALHILAAGSATFVIQAVTAWTTSILVRRDGLSTAEAGAVFGAIVLVVGPAGHGLGGLLLDRLAPAWRRRAPALVLGLSLAAMLPGLALFCLAAGAPALAGLAAASLALGLATPAAFAGIQTMTPRGLRARASALFLAANTLIGFGLGPSVVGWLTDRVFGDAALHLSLLIAGTGAAMLGLLASALRLGLFTGVPVKGGGPGRR